MPHRAFWDRSAGQVNVTGLDFAESDFAVSDYASFCPASSGISHMQHLALPQVTLFHILIGNWFRSVSFQPTSIAAPPPEYTPPAAKVQALSFRLPYTRTGCQSIFLKRRPIRSFFRRVMHNKHEKIPYLNICLLFMQGLRQQKAVKPGNAC